LSLIFKLQLQLFLLLLWLLWKPLALLLPSQLPMRHVKSE